jgi:hypothetical protein
MPEHILLDSDIVLKMCAYASGQKLIDVTTQGEYPPAILVVAGFALPKQVRRSRRIKDKERAAAELALVLDRAERLEPTPEEVLLAADLEEAAIRDGLPLDAGESQLVAILIHRLAPLCITGDKRALNALAQVAPSAADHRLACLEQMTIAAISEEDVSAFRSAVCEEREMDTTMSICCSCSSETVGRAQLVEGLRSYIDDLRRTAGRLLIESDDLVAIIPQENRIGLG